jgi:hypothetical protein
MWSPSQPRSSGLEVRYSGGRERCGGNEEGREMEEDRVVTFCELRHTQLTGSVHCTLETDKRAVRLACTGNVHLPRIPSMPQGRVIPVPYTTQVTAIDFSAGMESCLIASTRRCSMVSSLWAPASKVSLRESLRFQFQYFVQLAERWIACTPLRVNVFVKLATQQHLEYYWKALFETLCIVISGLEAVSSRNLAGRIATAPWAVADVLCSRTQHGALTIPHVAWTGRNIGCRFRSIRALMP